MKTSDFDFNLPLELIAQTPLKDRSSSRLLVLNKKTGQIKHEQFHDITKYLKTGDVLVLNDTKVIPARLYGVKEDTKAHMEILLLHQEGDFWEALVKPQRRCKVGTVISFGDGLLKAKCIKVLEEGICHFNLIYDGILYEILDQLGEMPIPPYIHEKLTDKDRYQTVYAKNPGSAAAPTAGLHFTKELIEEIKQMGVNVCYVTLHVGLGTFRPVNVDDVTNHKMHEEYYEITSETADILNQALKEKRRIIAVGTTSTRTLESAYHNGYQACKNKTDIFIYPGYQFKAVSCQITNFHLPKSTLVMLVSSFCNKEMILNAYQEAIKEKYRFFSFGDAMLIYEE